VEFGLELLKVGIINRIGDGRKTQIMRDQWLPRDSGLKITALKKNSRKRWVNQLINTEDRSWNTTLLHELFHEHDTQAILRIKLPQQEQADRVAWHYETNGLFSVKSAYRLAYSLKHQLRDFTSSSTNTDGDRSLWNCVWKAEVPPKVRVFGWRLATDTLATKNNKFKRNLEVCSRCSICGVAEEDAYHAAVKCTKAVGLRHAMRAHWKLPKEHHFKKSGKDWLLLLLNQVDAITKARILLLFWRSWHLRNDIVHEQGKESIATSVSFLLSYNQPHDPCEGNGKTLHFDYPQANSQSSQTRKTAAWSAPPVDWLKLNTDASFIGIGQPSGAGAVVRDHRGVVLFAACSPMVSCDDAEEAEAKAALRGIKLLKDMGYTRIILELDCARAVTALRASHIDRSKNWATYDEAKSLLKDLDDHQILHTRRENNRVADALARTASSAGSCIWRDNLPDVIQDFVTQDMTRMLHR
jgi:ribonuclease HI